MTINPTQNPSRRSVSTRPDASGRGPGGGVEVVEISEHSIERDNPCPNPQPSSETVQRHPVTGCTKQPSRRLSVKLEGNP